MSGPKITGIPGQPPGAADAAEDKPAKQQASAKRDDSGAQVITKDLRKTPKTDERPMITLKDPPIEAQSEEEAIEMANLRGRAVFTKNGWVCPTISHERRAA